MLNYTNVIQFIAEALCSIYPPPPPTTVQEQFAHRTLGFRPPTATHVEFQTRTPQAHAHITPLLMDAGQRMHTKYGPRAARNLLLYAGDDTDSGRSSTMPSLVSSGSSVLSDL
jgi:hypothetical protein